MGYYNSCLRWKLLFIFLSALLLSSALFATSAFTITASIGRPYHGRLQNGVPFPTEFQGYYLRDQERAYATPEAIGTVLDAIDAVRAQYPDTCDLFIGDFSRPGGGPINMHRSHQNGRDVDLGMYVKGNRPVDTFIPMNEDNLDAAKTWRLVESLLNSQHVQYLFLDRRIQGLLHEYALTRGVDPAYLEAVFGNSRNSIIQHVRGHYDHMHVRFYTPWSTMAARVSDEDDQQRTVVEIAQQAYLPKKVNYYVKGSERSLEMLAQSFGVNQTDLCRWNRMHFNDVLTPGTCLVFYKRGFEVEPVHLARSLQPDAVPDSPAVQLASAGFSGTQGGRVVPVRHSLSARKSSLASSYTYTVHRGDTLEKVAKRAGMNVQTLCALNGLKPQTGVKPGQRIKLVSGQAAPSSVGDKNSGSSKTVRSVSLPQSKSSGGFVPAVYAAEKHDSLSKIARQRGIDLEGLCQINGMNKSTSLKSGQKIKILGGKGAVSVKATHTAQHSPSRQANPPANTLQANMKPAKDLKGKGDSAARQQTSSVQKTSEKKCSSAGTGAQLSKAEKKAKQKSKN